MKFETIYTWTKDKTHIPADELYSEYQLEGGMLIELDDDGKFVRIVGYGGGEPEDNTLYRDYSWIEREMNKLADIINSYRENEKNTA